MADHWQESDRYTWLTEYLSARGLETRIRWTIAAASIASCLLPLTMLFSASGPRGPLARTVTITAVVCVTIAATWWTRRWPTRRKAIGYAFIADAATAAICLSYHDPLIGLVGCILFTLIGGYIAFFHCGYVQAVNVCVGVTTATRLWWSAWQHSGDVIVTLNVYVVVTVATLALSAGHIMVHFFGIDVAGADIDPLTGLLNRRAFYRRADRLLAAHGSTAGRRLCVTMIDLDHFKRLNDSRGHQVGDSALIMVSNLTKEIADDAAIIARIGGEEFVVAEVGDLTETTTRATSLCAAIAATDFKITASIGVASLATPIVSAEGGDVIDMLIEIADAAMYDAKRAGGGRVGIQADSAPRRAPARVVSGDA
ncbi:MAG: GGDEF domain-containing protein [Mycobacterium sp.]|uniref:GGDEF domain-containing protein n=1 Tax=Mycobacterium sp. TaxID=1785 RepID=UPI001ECA09AA|nr:GGDEF domain-containing protein [Mycobacterium sp.]MBW0019577.1 GGDEF domain-containing protein [Mycobacterium sp.]